MSTLQGIESLVKGEGGISRTWEPNLVTGALGRRKELEGWNFKLKLLWGCSLRKNAQFWPGAATGGGQGRHTLPLKNGQKWQYWGVFLFLGTGNPFLATRIYFEDYFSQGRQQRGQGEQIASALKSQYRGLFLRFWVRETHFCPLAPPVAAPGQNWTFFRKLHAHRSLSLKFHPSSSFRLPSAPVTRFGSQVRLISPPL